MPTPQEREGRGMLRLEIRRLPPEVQAELHRLRATALEMRIPEDALWTLLAAAMQVPATARHDPRRIRRVPAPRFRTRLGLMCGRTSARKLRTRRIARAGR